MLGQQPNQKGVMGSKSANKISRDELLSMELSAHSNMVLVKVEQFREERKTKSGIILDVNPDTQYLEGEGGSHMADTTIVRGVVEKVPPGLLPEGDMLPWATEMAVKVGDDILWDYFDARNATTFICDEDEYLLIPYSSCYVVLRGDEILPLNGYLLFKEVYKEKGEYDVHEEVDPMMGEVVYLSPPVVYTNPYWQDDIDVNVGDIVTFRRKASRVFLERAKHFQTLPDRLFRHQRKDIAYRF